MELRVELADITTLEVDAIVNAANNGMRGGGGVDGAIHRAGGPAVLEDCVRRFPDGLATGDAGWTTGGNLPARWVIHTVGPNHRAGQTDRFLLESCYRRSLEAADEIGAQTVAFPLISAGVYGWPKGDAIAAAVDTVAAARTNVREVTFAAFNQATLEQLDYALARRTPFTILQAVRLLHDRGHGDIRVLPGMSASGMHWRVTLSIGDQHHRYTTGSGTEFLGGRVNLATPPEEVAEMVLKAFGHPEPREDTAYQRWYADLMDLVEQRDQLPIAYADYFDDADGWEIGWGSGVRYPAPLN